MFFTPGRAGVDYMYIVFVPGDIVWLFVFSFLLEKGILFIPFYTVVHR